LDALIDVIAAVEIDHPVSGDAALQAMPATRRVGSKLFSLEGLNTETGLWEHPRNGQRYSAFQSGVQLANRTGPLNEIEFSEFVTKLNTLLMPSTVRLSFQTCSKPWPVPASSTTLPAPMMHN
jgi:hypothetical protein